MTTRQYIGARYVPKFYENSVDGSTQWENNVVYDPMIWVTLQNGHIYLSKKEVPATIGTPAQNIEYWLDVGSYDGYIEDLQQQINAMKNGEIEGSLQYQINLLGITDTSLQEQITAISDALTALTGRVTTAENDIDVLEADDSSTIIFIGDSYGVDASVGGTSWATLLGSVYPSATFLILGGTGFASDTYISQNFLTMLTAHVNTLSTEQKKRIKQVIVVGGANDANLVYNGTTNVQTVSARISSFCSYVATNLPNAKVKNAFVGWFRNNVKHDAYNAVRDTYNSMRISNYAYYSQGEPIMRVNSHIETVDRIHPNPDSSYLLASFISNMVTNGDYHFSKNVVVTTAAITGLTPQPTVDNLGTIQAWYDGNDCNITILGVEANYGFWRVTFPAGTTVQPGASGRLLTVNGTPVGAVNPQVVTLPIAIYGDGAVYQGTYPVDIAIQENELVWRYAGHEAVNWRSAQFPMCSLSINLRHS